MFKVCDALCSVGRTAYTPPLPLTPCTTQYGVPTANHHSSRGNRRNVQLDEPRAGKADNCSRVAVAALQLPLPRIRISKHSPRAQATSAARKNYTLCDMFAFGLIVKWLIVGDVADVPFAGLPTDQVIRVHGSLESSGGTMVHPFIADLSRVPPVFRPLIQARTPPLPPTIRVSIHCATPPQET